MAPVFCCHELPDRGQQVTRPIGGHTMADYQTNGFTRFRGADRRLPPGGCNYLVNYLVN
jgi:hypothetical protein